MVSRNPATQQFVQAGLTAGASFLMGRFRQMHVQAMGEGEQQQQQQQQQQAGAAPAAASSASATSSRGGSSTSSAAAPAAAAPEVEQLRKADADAKSAALQTDKVSCPPGVWVQRAAS